MSWSVVAEEESATGEQDPESNDPLEGHDGVGVAGGRRAQAVSADAIHQRAHIVKAWYHHALDDCLCDDANGNLETCSHEVGVQSTALLPSALHQADLFVQVYIHCGSCTQPVC